MVDVLAALVGKPESVRGYYDFYGPLVFNGGFGFPVPLPHQTMSGDKEQITHDFAGYVSGGYQSSGIVFAPMPCLATHWCAPAGLLVSSHS